MIDFVPSPSTTKPNARPAELEHERRLAPGVVDGAAAECPASSPEVASASASALRLPASSAS